LVPNQLFGAHETQYLQNKLSNINYGSSSSENRKSMKLRYKITKYVFSKMLKKLKALYLLEKYFLKI
jgi:hypothetical protein